MSAKSLHLNLLSPQEMTPTSSVRLKVLLPIVAGLVGACVLIAAAYFGIELMIVNSQVSGVRSEIDKLARESAENDRISAKHRDLQSEYDQFDFYMHGRVERGELLKQLAGAIPENITLTALSIPIQPEQSLHFPPGTRLPPLQGPTQTVEQVELRLTGLAASEQDVFNLMKALEGNTFTGLVSIVKNPAKGERESPRVLAFRQEAIGQNQGMPMSEHRHVFFDIVYDIKPREFVK